jgi:trans-2,3-dihydro-3-hydroxyanthranilate isomerase
MKKIPYYIVDVFATQQYEGNQLAVFIDLENQISDSLMQQMATEINFAETTFIKKDKGNNRFVVRIFTPEHEVPFAGHPSIGTSYIIAKFLLPHVPSTLTLELAHSDIAITIAQPNNIDTSILAMRQAQPEFRETFAHATITQELGIPAEYLNTSLPIQEISTGLPYIIIPLAHLKAIESLRFDYATIQQFLFKRNKYRTNSTTGHSTSLFFFTTETYQPNHDFNTRMILLENGRVSEDAATGSANGCFLAYLLKYQQSPLDAIVEQGFQMNRNSYLYINGTAQDNQYEINVGGKTQLVAEGSWYIA